MMDLKIEEYLDEHAFLDKVLNTVIELSDDPDKVFMMGILQKDLEEIATEHTEYAYCFIVLIPSTDKFYYSVGTEIITPSEACGLIARLGIEATHLEEGTSRYCRNEEKSKKASIRFGESVIAAMDAHENKFGLNGMSEKPMHLFNIGVPY